MTFGVTLRDSEEKAPLPATSSAATDRGMKLITPNNNAKAKHETQIAAIFRHEADLR